MITITSREWLAGILAVNFPFINLKTTATIAATESVTETRQTATTTTNSNVYPSSENLENEMLHVGVETKIFKPQVV